MHIRYEALRKVIKGAGLTFDKELVVEGAHTWEGGALAVSDLLNLPKPPTAILCCNDVAAIGALKTLSAKGLQAGRDIALIGFDDLTICRFTQPALTTIRFSPGEIAKLAFHALLEEIRGETLTQHEYATRFVLRESTCAPRH